MEPMRLTNIGEDIDSTAVMPQLDIRVLSAALEKVDQQRSDVASDIPTEAARATTPEWKLADQVAALKDQLASLQAALRENENRHSRLSKRHETLLQKFEERESVLVDNQLALNQARKKLTALELKLQHHLTEAADLRQVVTASTQQRRQRELFILKQAGEIKRLRNLLP
jgi:chromosome segregation ATPase